MNLKDSFSPYRRMNFSDIEDIYRSRITLLDILEGRGYDVTPFRKFSPLEIAKAIGSTTSTDPLLALNFVAKKVDAEDVRVCIVSYVKLTRQKLGSYFDSHPSEDTGETIIMMNEPVTDFHHQHALMLYMSRKVKVSIFSIDHLVNNPLNHVLVPKHELVPADQEEALMKKHNIPSKSKFPLIRYHVDPIIRIIGGVPGNIVKITRPSPTAGECIYYRCVSP